MASSIEGGHLVDCVIIPGLGPETIICNGAEVSLEEAMMHPRFGSTLPSDIGAGRRDFVQERALG